MKQTFKKIIVGVLTWEAKIVLKKYKPKIIGVTGSVGKTSTKNAIYTALLDSVSVRKTMKSMNSEVGVPLTILGLQNAWSNPFAWFINIIEGLLMVMLPFKYPEWLVIEVGADKPSDIEDIASWLKPDITVITRFGDVPVHIEFFPSIEDLINEKGALARALKPEGTLVLNHDDKRVLSFGEGELRKKLTYGFEAGSEVIASNDHIVYTPYENSELEFPEGVGFTIEYGGIQYPCILNAGLGRQHIYPMLAAFAVAVSIGIAPEKIVKNLNVHIPPKGRMHLIAGEKNTLIIDDSYNASPVAVEAGLNVVKDLKVPGRKIAVLGDMLELGQYSIDQHRKMGELARSVVDVLVTVGVRSRTMADAALDAGMDEKNVLQFESSEEAGKFLESFISSGDLIFVKGSQAMRMERVVEEIMAHPEKKDTLLVRQDKQWLRRK